MLLPINSLDANTTGAIDASSITNLSGTAYEIYTSSGISGLGNEAITVTDSSITVAEANFQLLPLVLLQQL